MKRRRGGWGVSPGGDTDDPALQPEQHWRDEAKGGGGSSRFSTLRVWFGLIFIRKNGNGWGWWGGEEEGWGVSPGGDPDDPAQQPEQHWRDEENTRRSLAQASSTTVHIRGSVPLTNGSGSNSGSDSFFSNFKDAKKYIFPYIFFL